jgi:hypothetical protein
MSEEIAVQRTPPKTFLDIFRPKRNDEVRNQRPQIGFWRPIFSRKFGYPAATAVM